MKIELTNVREEILVRRSIDLLIDNVKHSIYMCNEDVISIHIIEEDKNRSLGRRLVKVTGLSLTQFLTLVEEKLTYDFFNNDDFPESFELFEDSLLLNI